MEKLNSRRMTFICLTVFIAVFILIIAISKYYLVDRNVGSKNFDLYYKSFGIGVMIFSFLYWTVGAGLVIRIMSKYF